MFNPNCKYYEIRHGKMFGNCDHPKMKGWFFKKLCILPNKECKLWKEYPRPTKPSPKPPEKIYV